MQYSMAYTLRLKLHSMADTLLDLNYIEWQTYTLRLKLHSMADTTLELNYTEWQTYF